MAGLFEHFRQGDCMFNTSKEFLLYLSEKHKVAHKVWVVNYEEGVPDYATAVGRILVGFQFENKSEYVYPDGTISYGMIVEGGLAGVDGVEGDAYILVASNAPADLRLVLAHEFCHILQMFVWRTWPKGLVHPDKDDPLEVEAHAFAHREIKELGDQRFRMN